jgi:hypothetical protein
VGVGTTSYGPRNRIARLPNGARIGSGIDQVLSEQENSPLPWIPGKQRVQNQEAFSLYMDSRPYDKRFASRQVLLAVIFSFRNAPDCQTGHETAIS